VFRTCACPLCTPSQIFTREIFGVHSCDCMEAYTEPTALILIEVIIYSLGFVALLGAASMLHACLHAEPLIEVVSLSSNSSKTRPSRQKQSVNPSGSIHSLFLSNKITKVLRKHDDRARSVWSYTPNLGATAQTRCEGPLSRCFSQYRTLTVRSWCQG
jgi:hypothetical protein